PRRPHTWSPLFPYTTLFRSIGANAAIYSLFDQLLMAPLPVHQPERLVNLAAPGPKSGSTSCNNAGDCDVIFSYPMFRDIEKAQRSEEHTSELQSRENLVCRL